MPVEMANPVPGDSSCSTVAGLVDVLLKQRLLEASQADELSALQTRFDNPRALARELIQRGWLTPYQVNQLFLGRAPQLVLGSYVLLERLGEGGMGQVFKGRHQNLGRMAALKLIRKDRLANEEVVHRFRREIQAVAQLSHPNVVIAFDADHSGETHFFAMEYVEGTDLGKLVKQSGPLPIEQACEYIRQAALGLQHAHERGLIHRDIKPSNLLLATRGSVVKVLDLGLARLIRTSEEDHASTLTNQGALMGTPDFIAPEQARNSHNIDGRADLYSLGCTFFYLLTGQVPFPADTSTEKLYRHWTEEVRPPEQVRADIPTAVSAVVRRLMAKRPEDRFQTAAALAEALTPPIGSNGTLSEAPTATPAVAPLGPYEAAPVALAVAHLSTTPLDSPAPPMAVAVAAPASTAIAVAVAAPVSTPVALAVQAPSTTAVDLPAAMPVAEALPLRPAEMRRYVAAGLLGGILLVSLIAVIWLAVRSSRNAPVASTTRHLPGVAAAPTSREQQADVEFQALTGRFNHPGSDEEQLRHDLIQYRIKFPSQSALGVRAAEMLSQVHTPLDDLQRRQISNAELYDGLPRNAVAVLGERRWRHWGPIQQTAISPDGTTVASCGIDGVRLWNAKTGRELSRFDAPPALALVFLDKGKSLAVGTPRGELVVFDVSKEEQEPKTVQGPAGPISCMAVAPNGQYAASAREGGPIVVWATDTGKEECRMTGHKGRVNALAFSADGKSVASVGEDKTVRTWDAATGKKIASLTEHEAPVRSVGFSANGRSLATGDEMGTIFVWDLDAGKSMSNWQGHRGPVTALLWTQSSKGLITAGGRDGYVQLWDPKSDDPAIPLSRHRGSVDSLAYCPTGPLLASAGTSGLVRVWDFATGDEAAPPEGPFGALLAVAVSPDGQTIATAGFDHIVHLWDTQRLRERASIPSHTQAVNTLAFSGDGQRLVSGGDDGMIHIWNPLTGVERESLGKTTQRGQILSVAVSPDGKTLAAGSWHNDSRGDAGDLRLWDVTDRRERVTVKAHKHGLTGVAISPDSQLIASGSWDGTVRFSEWLSGKERLHIDQGAPVESVAFHPSLGVVAAGDREGNIKFWTTAGKPAAPTIIQHKAPVLSVAFSPDGKWLASADQQGMIYLWGWQGNVKLSTTKLAGAVYDIAFTPDGRHLATANGNGTCYLLRLGEYRPRQ